MAINIGNTTNKNEAATTVEKEIIVLKTVNMILNYDATPVESMATSTDTAGHHCSIRRLAKTSAPVLPELPLHQAHQVCVEII